MGYSELMKEVEGVLAEAKPHVWNQPGIGRAGLMKLVELGAIDKKEVFALPKFVKDTPFPEKFWWDSVDEVWGKPEMWDEKNKPAYGKVMRAWKEKVKTEFGFEPTRTKEQSMTDHIAKEIEKANKLVAAAAEKQKAKVASEDWQRWWMPDEITEGDCDECGK